MPVFHAATPQQVQQAVQTALAEKTPLDIIGGGSKRGLGRATAAGHGLDVSALAGIIEHDHDELTLTTRPGTSLGEIEAALASRRQMLAFEPPGWHGVFAAHGAPAATPTIGGSIAANLAGPRRIRAGGPRDHLLGVAAVNGRAEAWRGGGRVVKNVSGYDMPKLQCGAFGTLSVLTELTLRLVPAPATTSTLLIATETLAAACQMMARALNTPQDVSAAACLPAGIAARAGVPRAGQFIVLLRLEGTSPSVIDRAATLRRQFSAFAELDTPESKAVWHDIGAVSPLLANPDAMLWRLCPTPSLAPEILAALTDLSDQVFLDWGGGLIWLAVPAATPDAAAASIRAAIGPHGHATLVRAPAPLRARLPVFQPLAPPLAALNARIRAAFDPAHILNRGRLVPEP